MQLSPKVDVGNLILAPFGQISTSPLPTGGYLSLRGGEAHQGPRRHLCGTFLMRTHLQMRSHKGAGCVNEKNEPFVKTHVRDLGKCEKKKAFVKNVSLLRPGEINQCMLFQQENSQMGRWL